MCFIDRYVEGHLSRSSKVIWFASNVYADRYHNLHHSMEAALNSDLHHESMKSHFQYLHDKGMWVGLNGLMALHSCFRQATLVRQIGSYIANFDLHPYITRWTDLTICGGKHHVPQYCLAQYCPALSYLTAIPANKPFCNVAVNPCLHTGLELSFHWQPVRAGALLRSGALSKYAVEHSHTIHTAILSGFLGEFNAWLVVRSPPAGLLLGWIIGNPSRHLLEWLGCTIQHVTSQGE
jgi:hypothetical protein